MKSKETWTVINIDNSLLHLNAGEKAAFSNEVKWWSRRHKSRGVGGCLLVFTLRITTACVACLRRYIGTIWISLICRDLVVVVFPCQGGQPFEQTDYAVMVSLQETNPWEKIPLKMSKTVREDSRAQGTFGHVNASIRHKTATWHHTKSPTHQSSQ